MRIVHLIWQFKLGGAEAMLVDIANQQSLSEDVALIVGNAVVEQTLLDQLSHKVNIQLLGRPEGSQNPWYLFKLYRMLKRLKADIVHAHLDSFIRILKYIRVPRVLTVHNTGIPLSPQTNQFDAVYCISDAVSYDLKKRYPKLLTHVIRNGINFSGMRQRVSYGHKPFRIVQVSRLDHHQKGQDILMRAIRKVNDSQGDGQVMVDFIGEGPSQDFLFNLNDELGLGACCRFLGMRSRSDVYENLHSYDLQVQPSRFEGFGLTVVEGMAAGVPVLVSDVEGPMEVIDRGRYGYFFRNEDVEDCAKQILDIMQSSTLPEFVNERKAAEQYAKNTFDVATTADKYVRDYARVIASKTLPTASGR